MHQKRDDYSWKNKSRAKIKKFLAQSFVFSENYFKDILGTRALKIKLNFFEHFYPILHFYKYP